MPQPREFRRRTRRPQPLGALLAGLSFGACSGISGEPGAGRDGGDPLAGPGGGPTGRNLQRIRRWSERRRDVQRFLNYRKSNSQTLGGSVKGSSFEMTSS
jgi:hypothetical protein